MNVKPESGQLCFVELVSLRSETLSEGFLFSKPESAMAGRCEIGFPDVFAKPESGQLCFVECRVALSMPSGVGLCTSEQPDPQCAACTADLLALRFCGRSRSLLSLAGLPALRFCGTSSLLAKSEIGPAEFVKSEIGPAELEIYLAKSEADFARCQIGLARCEIGHADLKFYQGCLLAVHSPPYAVRFPP